MTIGVLSRTTQQCGMLVAVLLVSGCYTPTAAWRGTGEFRGEETRRQTLVVDQTPNVQLTRAGDDAVARFTQTRTCEDELVGTNLVERQVRPERRLTWPAEAIVGIGGAIGILYVASTTFGKWHDSTDFTPVLLIDGAAIALAMTYLAATPPTREISRWNRLGPGSTTVPVADSRRPCGPPEAVPHTAVTAVMSFPEVHQRLVWQTRTDDEGLAHFSLARARGVLERCGSGWLELESLGSTRLGGTDAAEADLSSPLLRLAVPAEGPRLVSAEGAWTELARRCQNSRPTANRQAP